MTNTGPLTEQPAHNSGPPATMALGSAQSPVTDAPGAANYPGSGSFGRYEVLEEIARGGMGIVYRARQLGLNRIVALKMIIKGELAGPSELRRFRIEAEAAAGLDHPNIVPVYEVGEHEGNPFFTMKLIEGGSLADLLATRRSALTGLSERSQKDMARLVATVARAVHHAHRRGILHRDLKPANILLHRDAAQPADCDLRTVNPLVTDFGLAKRARADGAISQSMQIVGTASYMAPEQAVSDGAALTVAADIYSLGAVLYEMLTGRPPFQADSFLGTLIQVVQQLPVPPCQLDASIDRDLERICLKCLRKEPGERYASAEALADDLEHWVAGEPVSVHLLGGTERIGRWARRNRGAALALAALAGLVVAGIAYSTMLNFHLSATADDLMAARQAADANARKAQTNALEAARNAEREAEARVAADQAHAAALAALKNEQLALHEEKTQRAKSRQLLVRQYVSNGAGLLDLGDPLGALAWFGAALRLESGDPHAEQPHRIRIAAALKRCPRLAEAIFHDSGVRAFCLSRDGRWLVTADGDGKTQAWDVATGERVGQLSQAAGAVTHVQFVSDGNRLLVATKAGAARLWDWRGDKPVSPELVHGAEIKYVDLSADGRLVVTAGKAAGGPGGEARVWDWASGKQLAKPIRLKLPIIATMFSQDDRLLYTLNTAHNLRAWQVATGQALPAPLALTNKITGLWLCPTSQQVLLGQGTMAQMRDLATRQPVGRPLTHGADVLLAAFSPDGRYVVTAGWDKTARVWDASDGQALTPPLRHPRRLWGAALDNSGQRLVTSCEDGAVRLWDLRKRDEATPAVKLKAVGEVLAVAPGGLAVLAAGKGKPRVWNSSTGLPLSAPLPGSKITQSAFSPDGKWLATLDPESLRLTVVGAKKLKSRVLSPSAKVLRIAFSPDGKCLAARLAGEQLRIWDAATGAEIVAGKLPGIKTWDLPAISADGRRVITLKSKRAVQVWDLAASKAVLPVLMHAANVIHASYSPENTQLATACADGMVHLWNANTGEPLTQPLAHGQSLNFVGYSLNGRMLVSTGSDGTARVWDTQTGQILTPLLHQTDAISTASFTAQGDRLATVSKSGSLHIWDLRPDNRPMADLLLLSKLLSGQQIHPASGGLIPFQSGNSRQAWAHLRARFPTEFGRE